MEQAIIDQTIKALERNHFEVYLANDRQKARDIFFQEIFDKIKPTTISWGDSETMKATGILSEIKQRPDCILIQPGPKNILAPPSPPCRFIRHGDQCPHPTRPTRQRGHGR